VLDLRAHWRHYALLLGIVLLAAVLRLYRLEALPPGTWHDEAYNGLDALSLLRGAPRPLFHEVWEQIAWAEEMETLPNRRWPIFFYGTYGREPLFCYLEALSLGVIGVRVLALRIWPALFGIATVPAVYWLAQEMFHEDPRRARRIGLLAALGVATWYMLLHFSRLGIRGMMLPFLSSLTLACMLRGLRTGRLSAWAAGGFWLGVSLYTLSSARMVPLAIVAWWLVLAWCRPGFLRHRWREWMLVIAVSAIVFAPLGLFYLRNPDWFWMRTQYILEDNLDVETVGERYVNNLVRVLGAFFYRGEDFIRHNLPKRPMLDPVQALWFLVGLAVAVVQGWRTLARRVPGNAAHLILLIWLPVLLLPTYLTSDAPHFGRSLGIAPAVAVLMGLGIDRLWTWAQGRKEFLHAVPSLVILGLLYTGSRTTYDYFWVWAGHPGLDEAFLVDLVDLAKAARALPEQEMVYMAPPATRYAAILFTLGGHEHNRIKSFTGEAGAVPAGREGTAVTYFIRAGDEASLPLLQRRLPQGTVDAASPYFTAYRVPAAGARVQPSTSVAANWVGKVELLGIDLSPGPYAPGTEVSVTVYWRALSEMDRPYTFFVHLLGPENPATGTPLWAQHDAQPAGGTYATLGWDVGEIVIDEYSLVIPGDVPPGEYELSAGFYYLPTLERLPVIDRGGQVTGDRVVLERLNVSR